MPDFSISPGTYSLSVVQPKEEEEEDDDDDDDDGDDDDDDGDDSDLRLPSNNSIHLLTVAWLCFSQHTIGGKNAFLLTPKTSPPRKTSKRIAYVSRTLWETSVPNSFPPPWERRCRQWEYYPDSRMEAHRKGWSKPGQTIQLDLDSQCHLQSQALVNIMHIYIHTCIYI